MRLGPLCCCLLLISGCTERVAPNVEENTNLVRVLEDQPVVFPEIEEQAAKPAPVPVEDPVLGSKIARVITATLETVPRAATQLSQLHEVNVKVDIEGVDPSELVVEFIAPDGTAFSRDARRLTATRYHRQQVEVSMPVSGTVISSLQLVGTWHARVLHDGAEISSMGFEVTR
jgi:hypothetical protein